MTDLFIRKTDDELRDAGWNPEWISKDYDADGCPYVVVRDPQEVCSQCGGSTAGYTVVDLSSAASIGTAWTHFDGENDAIETADMLNRAWLRGLRHGRASAT